MTDRQNPSDGMAIPSWFLRIVSAFALVMTVGGVPWAAWTTYTLIGLQNSMPLVAKSTDDLRSLVDRHEARIQVIDATRFTPGDGQHIIGGLESRLDRMEVKIDGLQTKIDGLQREFDRSGSWSRTQPPAKPPSKDGG